VRTRLSRRAAAVVAAVTAALLLSGCGETPPGSASVVNGHTITRQQVDDLAAAQCAGVELASKQGQGQVVPRKQLTERALGLLIDIRLNLDYGKSLGLTPRADQTAADYAQVEPLIKALPAKYQSYLADVFHDWADGRDMVKQVGETATGQTSNASNADQVLNAGYAKRQSWLEKDATIKTDPRYAPGKIGWPGEGDSSVSKPVSSFARSAGAAQPSAAFVGGLPAGQRCG
jgi:hypothetical protein